MQRSGRPMEMLEGKNMVEIGFGIGTLVLLAAIAYGLYQSARRDPRNEAVTEEATRDLYRNPDTYEQREAERRSRLHV